MSISKRLWTKMVNFAEAFDGVDGPVGDYILSLGKRVDKLERDLAHLEELRHSEPADGSTRNSRNTA